MATEEKRYYLSSNLRIFSWLTGLGMLYTAYKPIMFMCMNTDYLLNRNMIKLN